MFKPFARRGAKKSLGRFCLGFQGLGFRVFERKCENEVKVFLLYSYFNQGPKRRTIPSSALAAGRVECPTTVVEKGLRLCGAGCVCVCVFKSDGSEYE